MTARTLMVQGTASSVGKSLLVTALCRVYARRGLRVAPFKSQNMSLNSAVTPDGAEIGRAQLAQAEAARAIPCADMNPILLKPEGLASSQVVVLGKPIGSFHFRDYQRQRDELREVAGAALDRLRAKNDLVLIEGAGSPAEVNLKAHDLSNMWVAERADAKVVLVTDIDRGGALAALIGTLALLEPHERARVGALVVNRFRGDPSLFRDGVTFLEERTGLPVAGVIPHLGDSGVASEDSLDLRLEGATAGAVIAVVRFPRLSNFDELEPLQRQPGFALRWCTQPRDLDGAALVILPGSKCTVGDLTWLRATGLAEAISARAAAGGPILGICGGYQMLGERIFDPLGVESVEREAPGLGLLPIETHFQRDKVTQPVELQLGTRTPLVGGSQEVARGYQIHCGRAVAHPGAIPLGRIVRRGAQTTQEAEGAVRGAVFGTLVHGLFENYAVRVALAASLGVARPEASAVDPYDRVADHFAAALDLSLFDRLINS